jgi:hypothetical protein
LQNKSQKSFYDCLKGPWHKIFDPWFFHKTTPPRPLRQELKPFSIWINIRLENRLCNGRFLSQRAPLWLTQRSHWLHCDVHSVVIDSAVTCTAESLTPLWLQSWFFQRILIHAQQSHWHCCADKQISKKFRRSHWLHCYSPLKI